MKPASYTLIVLAILILGILHIQLDTHLNLLEQWRLLREPGHAETFADIFYLYAQLPRLCMALLIGAMLGLVGSLMQQLTQNNLTSPLTLGTSAGAWLALVIMNIWFVDWVANYSAFAAMIGASVAFLIVVMIAGVRNMTGLPLVVSGMVVNIMLGSIATALVLLNNEFAQNVFMWGAGDLTQQGWGQFHWLLPRTWIALLLVFFAPRILSILKLGQDGAAARGLPVLPAFATLMVIGVWLVSVSITTVGIISFIGLLTPNIARASGARTPRQELLLSALLGSLLLIATDSLSLGLSLWLEDIVPSGVTAAAIGAPALIWFARRQVTAQDQINLSMVGRSSTGRNIFLLLVGALLLGLGCYFYLSLDSQGWVLAAPNQYQWQLRWPRALTAVSVGVALAIAGTLLQRIVYNPLASPDILGVSSGATFALIISGIISGTAMASFGWGIAFSGSIAVLAVLLFLTRKRQFVPSNFVLIGIALSALLESLVQFALAKGSGDSYKTLLWLTGSTYRTTADQALALATVVVILAMISLLLSRWFTLISIGRDFSVARGLNARLVNQVALCLVALLCAVSTATMGPVAFVGLVSPHMALMLGARTFQPQVVVASLIGCSLMLWADWLGQVVIFPGQIAAGTLVAILGSGYFLLLMLTSKYR
ncbi:Fe(3+)-hydroxamate ABC transporter permease FhuB [Vibrio sp. WXL210]|uniref:Fe(3+)-hydroxamate ABC transporter permease FhuB n=1 Tax=Vibrio sp. WXL210 TaxID=3450709 RepID=UPI003EC738DC